MFIHLLISFSSFFILKEIHIFSSQDKCSISRHTVVVFNIWHKEAKVNILFLWNKYERSISMRRMCKDKIKIYKSLTLSMRLIRWWQKSPARALEYLQLPWKPSSSAVGGKPRRLMSLRSLYASLLRLMSRIRLHLSSPSLWFCCTFYSLSSILLLLHAIPSLLFLFPSSRRREHTIQKCPDATSSKPTEEALRRPETRSPLREAEVREHLVHVNDFTVKGPARGI